MTTERAPHDEPQHGPEHDKHEHVPQPPSPTGATGGGAPFARTVLWLVLAASILLAGWLVWHVTAPVWKRLIEEYVTGG
jgi:hypothetical protein